jgi:hypothetical protein
MKRVRLPRRGGDLGRLYQLIHPLVHWTADWKACYPTRTHLVDLSSMRQRNPHNWTGELRDELGNCAGQGVAPMTLRSPSFRSISCSADMSMPPKTACSWSMSLSSTSSPRQCSSSRSDDLDRLRRAGDMAGWTYLCRRKEGRRAASQRGGGRCPRGGPLWAWSSASVGCHN